MNTTKITLPSSHWIEVREQNGNDEGLLTEVGAEKRNEHLSNYLAAIIVNSSYNKKLIPLDIDKWRLADKYYAMIAIRIFNQGPMLEFKYPGKVTKTKYTIEQDLTIFVKDFNEGTKLPKIDEPGYSPYYIKPFLNKELQREIELSSGKLIKYTFMNTKGENLVLAKESDTLNSNDILKCRFLEYKSADTGNEYLKVENFDIFNSRDLRELRADIFKFDEPSQLQIRFKEPEGNSDVVLELFDIPDFLVPAGI